MNSFLSWIGGKKSLRKQLLAEFPESIDRYVEVFGGAGWLLFSKEKHAKFEVYNDVNSNLVNLFRCVKYHPETLQQELDYLLMSREMFFDSVDQLGGRGQTDIQRAARFFIVVRESFGNDMKSFCCNNRGITKMKDYLGEVSERLERVVIENQDFEKILKTYDRPGALFYLDPPYYEAEKYYPDRFNPDDHIRLQSALRIIKGKFLLSYNDCPEIRDLYTGYTLIEVERMNNLTAKSTNTRYKELIIKNY